MIKHVLFDIGNVLMDFLRAEYTHSPFGNGTGTIESVSRAIWQSGSSKKRIIHAQERHTHTVCLSFPLMCDIAIGREMKPFIPWKHDGH